jgi:hypothetical protein
MLGQSRNVDRDVSDVAARWPNFGCIELPGGGLVAAPWRQRSPRQQPWCGSNAADATGPRRQDSVNGMTPT